jgi:hypothetical protein
MRQTWLAGLTVAVVLATSLSAAAEAPIKVELLDCRMIWDGAHNNSFADMVRFENKWYVCVREAASHGVPGDGKARVIRSDGAGKRIQDWKWESVAYLDYEDSTHDNWDVRDPKLSVTPDGRLMLCAAAAPLDSKFERQNFVWFSKDGTDWTDGPHKIGQDNWWMWRVFWHPDGTAYGSDFGDVTVFPRDKSPQGWPAKGPRGWAARLQRSRFPAKTDSGLDFQVHATLAVNATEAGLVFRRDGSAVMLSRNDNNTNWRYIIGVSEKGDYTKWTTREQTDARLGGPALLELPDGNIVVASRVFNKSKKTGPRCRTRICWLDTDGFELVRLLTLPGGGDTGYPGMLWHDGHLWVVYYSGNANRTKVYLAKLRVRLGRAVDFTMFRFSQLM